MFQPIFPSSILLRESTGRRKELDRYPVCKVRPSEKHVCRFSTYRRLDLQVSQHNIYEERVERAQMDIVLCGWCEFV